MALNWPLPSKVLDLFAEFRNKTNGLPVPCGNGLLGALVYHGIDGIDAAEKQGMRELALRGGPWTASEADLLLEYCESDVRGLSELFFRMLPQFDLPRALLRGKYMGAVAQMENCGIPIDVNMLAALRNNWDVLKRQLISHVDIYRVYESGVFKAERWAQLIEALHICWPRLASGRLDLTDDTFRMMAERYPSIVEPYRQLRFMLSQMRLEELAIGTDGRNRCLLSAYRSVTGRNQPSNTRFVFGPAVWLRNLIRPRRGHGIAYIDWSQQEFGIAAYLSGDEAMIAAYESGDPYLAFAKQAGAVAAHDTKQTCGPIREQFKSCALGVLFGMGVDSLARRIGQSTAHARELLDLHRRSFPRFWRWSDAAVDYAELKGSINTVFGWTFHVGERANPRTIRNFPMLANGAEMLRLACILGTEQGIRICAPVHDAILIEAQVDILESEAIKTQAAMANASRYVLGHELRSEVKLFSYPNRFTDKRGDEMWNALCHILAKTSAAQTFS